MTQIKRTITPDEARQFYDRLGIRQDYQSWYEGEAVRQLIEHGRFEEAHEVFEFGCGTGALARELLRDYLPANARYVGVDISQTMVKLTRDRIAPFGARASVEQSSGRPEFNRPTGSFDRFVSTYVLDLLSPADIEAVLREARRLLRPDGRLCLASLTYAVTAWGKIVERAWLAAHRWNPIRVGGCRPLRLTDFLQAAEWQINYRHAVSIWGMTSEIVIAQPA